MEIFNLTPSDNFMIDNIIHVLMYLNNETGGAHLNEYIDWLESLRNTPTKIEFIDLGLPSGTKWANMNVGATHCTDYGRYFSDQDAEDIQEHSAIWKFDGTLPTADDYRELLDNTTHEWITLPFANITGMLFTSKVNDGVIFLPAAGYHRDISFQFQSAACYYWLITDNHKHCIQSMYCDNNISIVELASNYTFYSQPVRLVKK